MKQPWLLLQSAAQSSREYDHDTPDRRSTSSASLHGMALSPGDRRLLGPGRRPASHCEVGITADRSQALRVSPRSGLQEC